MIKISNNLQRLIYFVFMLLAANRALAQDDPLVAILRAEAMRVDQLLATAREIVHAFDNREAKKFLAKAEDFHRSAKQKASAGKLRRAQADLKQATKWAQLAIEAALKEPVQRLRNQLDELMRRAENLGDWHRQP